MYKVLKELGHGSYGVVYLLQTPDSAKYALKVVDLKRTNEDFLKEARILTNLCHAHLVKCHAFFEEKSTLYLITELCNHGTLGDFIKRQEVYIPERTVLRMLCELADVLRYLKVEKIIHRDLKPSNIFLAKHKSVKVGDVGVARELDYTSQEASTMIGTLLYMSPEALDNQKKYTYKTDIWSLGCCVHEMMTLERTFRNPMELLAQHIPAFPPEVYSIELQGLVLHMLEKEPEDRPDAYDLLHHASEIRGKRYKPGDMETKVNVDVDSREIRRAVTLFQEESPNTKGDLGRKASINSCGKHSKSRERNRHHLQQASAQPFENLERDSFGTVPNRHRKKGHSFPTDSSQDSEDLLACQEDFTDNTSSFGKPNTKVSLQGSAGSVTLYTRAQQAEYMNNSTQDSDDLSTSDVETSTLRVFAGQRKSLRESLQRRVSGSQTYSVDGQAMLRHQKF